MEQIVVAAIAATPPLTGVAWMVFRELKKIGHAVNGELEKKFDGVNSRLDDLGADMRDMRADVRDLKAEQRHHRLQHEGDGR
jgi:hypothetical protein